MLNRTTTTLPINILNIVQVTGLHGKNAAYGLLLPQSCREHRLCNSPSRALALRGGDRNIYFIISLCCSPCLPRGRNSGSFLQDGT